MGDIYRIYLEYCKHQVVLEPDNWDFKSNSNYTYMLEHNNFYHIGIKYYECLMNKYGDIINNNKEYIYNIIKINDQYGKPEKHAFNDLECSPTSLKYILHSLLFYDFINKYHLNNLDIIEIGGGYGGLCFIMKKIFELLNVNVSSYTIFDRIEASLLQKKYLNNLNTEVNICQIDNINNIKNNSVLISSYAFSEIPKNLQDQYIKEIFNPYIDYSFIVWNNIPVYNLNEAKYIINEELEYPQTSGGSIKNHYVYLIPKV